jgi:hypothetical protein
MVILAMPRMSTPVQKQLSQHGDVGRMLTQLQTFYLKLSKKMIGILPTYMQLSFCTATCLNKVKLISS